MQQETSNLHHVVSYFAKIHRLTEREREVVFYLSRYGYSNKSLASELCIAEKTVKNHIAKIQEKTNSGSTRELLSMIVAQSVMQYEQIQKAIVEPFRGSSNKVLVK